MPQHHKKYVKKKANYLLNQKSQKIVKNDSKSKKKRTDQIDFKPFTTLIMKIIKKNFGEHIVPKSKMLSSKKNCFFTILNCCEEKQILAEVYELFKKETILKVSQNKGKISRERRQILAYKHTQAFQLFIEGKLGQSMRQLFSKKQEAKFLAAKKQVEKHRRQLDLPEME